MKFFSKKLSSFYLIRDWLRNQKLIFLKLNLCMGVFLTGYQLSFGEFLYTKFHNRRRSLDLKEKGYIFGQFLDEFNLNRLRLESKRQLDFSLNESVIHPNANSWVLNKRHYADLSGGSLKEILDDVIASPKFIKFINNILGVGEFEITAKAIWRNYPEDTKILAQLPKEVNSTFFHVDNGGDIRDRLHLNLFIYLSEVTSENGPFTFYDIHNSKIINRKYIATIFKRLNLRTYDLVCKLEEEFSVNVGLMKPGDALVIDNQKCLHRAGFCTAGYRDILEIVFRKKL
jgi:hypothetical protein